jgi:hypothetical protein
VLFLARIIIFFIAPHLSMSDCSKFNQFQHQFQHQFPLKFNPESKPGLVKVLHKSLFAGEKKFFAAGSMVKFRVPMASMDEFDRNLWIKGGEIGFQNLLTVGSIISVIRFRTINQKKTSIPSIISKTRSVITISNRQTSDFPQTKNQVPSRSSSSTASTTSITAKARAWCRRKTCLKTAKNWFPMKFC